MYFEEHSQLPVADVGVPAGIRGRDRQALVRSLRRFHAGESGGVRMTAEVWRAVTPWLDADARHAISLYMNEEHHHGRLLERLLSNMGASIGGGDLSASAFRVVRRLMGLRAKLVVLQVAEVVGLAFYASVRDVSDDSALTKVMAAIHDDEHAHLEFGVVLLRRMIDAPGSRLTKAMRRAALVGWFRLVLVGALALMSLDNAPYLRRAGYRSVVGSARSEARWFIAAISERR